MAALEVALDPLRTEQAAIEGKLFPRLESDDLVVKDLQLDAALLAAEAAVCLDEALGLDARRQPRPRRDRQMRSKTFRDPVIVNGQRGHGSSHAPCVASPVSIGTRHVALWASPNSARRHRGQIC